MIHPTVRIHKTAEIEENVSIGAGTSVWDNVHIRRNTVIGENCIIGEKTYIAYDVIIGNGVKINSFVYICAGVSIEDQVMISAGTIFTNDLYPRAFDPDGITVKTSQPMEDILETKVRRGSSMGAGCRISAGIEIGKFSMVGMGSIVTRNVAPYELQYGMPARPRGFVCLCGKPVYKMDTKLNMQKGDIVTDSILLSCSRCKREYRLSSDNCFFLIEQE